jgi:hypothetical protein
LVPPLEGQGWTRDVPNQEQPDTSSAQSEQGPQSVVSNSAAENRLPAASSQVADEHAETHDATADTAVSVEQSPDTEVKVAWAPPERSVRSKSETHDCDSAQPPAEHILAHLTVGTSHAGPIAERLSCGRRNCTCSANRAGTLSCPSRSSGVQQGILRWCTAHGLAWPHRLHRRAFQQSVPCNGHCAVCGARKARQLQESAQSMCGPVPQQALTCCHKDTPEVMLCRVQQCHCHGAVPRCQQGASSSRASSDSADEHGHSPGTQRADECQKSSDARNAATHSVPCLVVGSHALKMPREFA